MTHACVNIDWMIIDPKVIEGCLKQDRKAQEQLYHSCFQLLMGVCSRYYKQKDEAVAAMNMGFLKILNHLNSKKENVPFEAWIRRIMINTVIDEFRKNKRHKETIDYRDFEDTFNDCQELISYNEADRRFDAQAIEQLIRQLPPVSREVFNLYAIDGYTHKEIGEMLNISIGTSKWHVSFARKQIKTWMADTIKVLN